MLHPLEQNIYQRLSQAKALNGLILAFSGGLDSKVLLHALVRLKQLKLIEGLKAVHIDHGLQSQSADWSLRCLRDCNDYQVALSCFELKLASQVSVNIEAQARDARYQVFDRLLGQDEWLLTAHHQDDQAETLLLRLLRGCGLDGASAIPCERTLGQGKLLRPMLDLSRQQIFEYAQSFELDWIEDPSNQSSDFSRNFLRNQVMPLLSGHWPGASRSLARFCQIASEQQSLLTELAEQDLGLCLVSPKVMAIAPFVRLSTARKHNLLHLWAKQAYAAAPSREQILSFTRQLDVNKNQSIDLKFSTGRIRRYKQQIFLCEALEPCPLGQVMNWPDLTQPLWMDNGLCLKALTSQENSPYSESDVDFELKTLALRSPQPGEVVRIVPRQGGETGCPDYRQHSTSLKTIFQEMNVPTWIRSWLPLVYYGEKLAAVAGLVVMKEFAGQTGLMKQEGLILQISRHAGRKNSQGNEHG